MAERPTLLVTNDDGIEAHGLKVLADALETLGDVWVVAPETERSGASHALSLRKPIPVRHLGAQRIAVDGTPADAVLLGVRKLIHRTPDVIVSGINHGPNLGDDVNYSGTVAAAMEGTIQRIPALAVSLASKSSREFDIAAEFSAAVTRRLLSRGLPGGWMLNINVPALSRDRIRGVKVARLGRRTYEDMIHEKGDGSDGQCFWIGEGRPVCEPADDTDCALILTGWITVTPLRLDMTDHSAIETVLDWALDLPETGKVT